MNYLRGFIPWIAFGALSTVGWQWGALAGLVIGLRLLMQDRKAGVAADALILEYSTIAYFAMLAAVAFLSPHSPIEQYSGAISFTWLALTAWGTLAVSHPFTLGIARRSTPEEYWNTPQFLSINKVITTAWATSFVLTAIAVAAVTAAQAGAVADTACQVIGFLIPALFTARYPKIVQARYAAANAGTNAGADATAG
jgi:hypothetical protein